MSKRTRLDQLERRATTPEKPELTVAQLEQAAAIVGAEEEHDPNWLLDLAKRRLDDPEAFAAMVDRVAVKVAAEDESVDEARTDLEWLFTRVTDVASRLNASGQTTARGMPG